MNSDSKAVSLGPKIRLFCIFMDIIWSKGVEVNKWTSISCGYENGVGCLKVGNLSQISQLTINLIHYMVWDTNLYIGGYDYHITMNKEVGADRGFDGCISDFEVLSQKIDMRSAINSANIQYCEETVPEVPSNQPVQEHECSGRNCKVVYVDPCSVQNPCENNGICENNGNTKICHCPIHFTGEYCQHSAPVTYSSQYTGNSYIELNKSTIVKSPAEEYISLVVSFSTMEPNGLLIWYGQPNGVAHNGQDFIALAVVGGFLEITFLFSGNERSVQIHTRVDDGMRHNAVLYRNGNSASVIFDNKRIFLETLQPTKSYLDFSGNIFIGGALNIGEFTGNRYVHGFKGCIVVYDENVPLNMSNSDVSGYNIIPCSESCLENSRHCVDGTVLTTTSATPTKDFELVTIYSEEEVDINKWTLISLGYENSVGFLKVGNSQKIIRHAIKRFNNIQLGKNLYIGGFDNRITLNMEVGANRGFDGCISELDIFYQKIDMINSIKDSANVQNCAYNGPEAPVQSIPQLHSVPSVQSSTEVCSPGYSGYNCDKIIDPCLAYDLCENNGICESNGNTSICDCPIHFTGEHCQHSAPITFSSQYRGTGFIELRRSAQLIAYSQNTMSLGISFSTKEPNGLLMWIGQIKGIAYNGQDFIALAVVNGLLELTFHLSGQTSFVRSDTRVDNGVFHVAILERRSNRFTLKLDYLSFNGETIYGNHNLLGNIFIGGAPEI
ncbi:pikachurin-like, partial [Contarinia nasturtii]|uniref:pikachurin-like n=1 Tax=Contarinia nasturtii TaxID=265458 RepID=UPI0012D374CB